MPEAPDSEIRALQLLFEALEPLDEDARNRVLDSREGASPATLASTH